MMDCTTTTTVGSSRLNQNDPEENHVVVVDDGCRSDKDDHHLDLECGGDGDRECCDHGGIGTNDDDKQNTNTNTTTNTTTTSGTTTTSCTSSNTTNTNPTTLRRSSPLPEYNEGDNNNDRHHPDRNQHPQPQDSSTSMIQRRSSYLLSLLQQSSNGIINIWKYIYLFSIILYVICNGGLLYVNLTHTQDYIEEHFYLPFHLVSFWCTFLFSLVEAIILYHYRNSTIRTHRVTRTTTLNYHKTTAPSSHYYTVPWTLVIIVGNMIAAFGIAVLFTIDPNKYERIAHISEYILQLAISTFDAMMLLVLVVLVKVTPLSIATTSNNNNNNNTLRETTLVSSPSLHGRNFTRLCFNQSLRCKWYSTVCDSIRQWIESERFFITCPIFFKSSSSLFSNSNTSIFVASDTFGRSFGARGTGGTFNKLVVSTSPADNNYNCDDDNPIRIHCTGAPVVVTMKAERRNTPINHPNPCMSNTQRNQQSPLTDTATKQYRTILVISQFIIAFVVLLLSIATYLFYTTDVEHTNWLDIVERMGGPEHAAHTMEFITEIFNGLFVFIFTYFTL
jgi:hypothetical protein